MTKYKPKRGGARAGSGRPRVGKFTRSFFVNDREHAALINYLKQIRNVVAKKAERSVVL